MSIKLLCIETTTQSCTVALSVDGQVEQVGGLMPRQQSEQILGLIDGLLRSHDIPLASLSAIALTHGPGSFTGIRLGMSIVQGLALPFDHPVIPIDTLQVLAQGAVRRCPEMTYQWAALDARLGEVYWAGFESKEGLAVSIHPPALSAPAALTAIAAMPDASVGIGSGFDVYPELMETWRVTSSVADAHPEACDLATLALDRYQREETCKVDALSPLYLRQKVTD